LVKKSPWPVPRPGSEQDVLPDALIAAIETEVEDAIATAAAEASIADVAEAVAEKVASGAQQPMAQLPNAVRHAPRRPGTALVATAAVAPDSTTEAAQEIVVAEAPTPAPSPNTPEIVTRMSTSGARHWGIAIGNYESRFAAEKMLLTTALMELGTLDDALRKVVPRSGGYDATFIGLSQERAALACRRLAARDMSCETIGPS